MRVSRAMRRRSWRISHLLVRCRCGVCELPRYLVVPVFRRPWGGRVARVSRAIWWRSGCISRFLRGRRFGDSQLVGYLRVPVFRRRRARGLASVSHAAWRRSRWISRLLVRGCCGVLELWRYLGVPDGAVRGLANLHAYLVLLGGDAGVSRTFRYVVSAGCASYRAISGFLYFAGCRAMGLRAYLIQHDADRLL